MEKVVIVSAVRTPIGSFGGVFKNVSATDLAITAVKGAMEKAGVDPKQIDEVILGNVLQAGSGQNVARQVAIRSDVPDYATSFTVNKLCGSGLKAIQLGAQSILLGENEVVIAGGTENMSQAPYLLPTARFGQRMGNGVMVDSMIQDGLTDAFHGYHMGITAENIAEKYNFTRAEQDELAAQSQQKAEVAMDKNQFFEEIIPVEVPARRGEKVVVTQDEYPKREITVEKLSKLRPAFKKDGTVTAGNASGLNDGAAIVILMSEKKAKSLNIKPLATIVSFANSGVDPAIMGTGPIPATQKALKKAGLKIEDMDLVEANEAFAAQALSVIKELNIDRSKLNVNGGAIALGHPIGASGARILVTLLHEMSKRDSNKGLATLCIGGGQGAAMIVEREK